jgi:single-stranded-DNA-specific exonuclease
MSLRWNLRAHDAQLVRSIESSCGVSPVVAQLLAIRGITRPDDVQSFLDLKMTGLRAPAELPGVTKAVEVIFSAIESKQKIFVYGDYDADGMTSTAILYRCLKILNADVSYFVPNRLDDGYGVSIDALDRIHQRGAKLIVTVDCGISSVKEVDHARSLGIEMVVTDHHHGLPDDPYPFPGLCGAGVAFKLAWALCQRHAGSPKLPEPLRNFLFGAVSLAAIGTVCDVVPLLDENRIIVHHGLNCMRQFANPGLTHLIRVTECDKKPRIDSGDIGFKIGPRLNAAGRLGQAQLGVEILTCDDDARAEALAKYITELNKNRDSIDRKILRAANKIVKENFNPECEPALVLAENDWHLGVIGIVAGRVAETYHRPTILLSIDPMGNRPAVGSCRSSCGVNLYEALSGCQEHLIKFGGHKAAAGLSIEPQKIEAFREEFCQQVIEQVSVDELVPDLDIDAEALIGQLTFSMMNDLDKLAPFGQSNPRPVMCASGVKLSAPAKPMGSEGRHLSLQLVQNNASIRAVAFGKGEWVKELSDTNREYDFAFKPVINEFRGRKSVEVQLIDYRVSVASVGV